MGDEDEAQTKASMSKAHALRLKFFGYRVMPPGGGDHFRVSVVRKSRTSRHGRFKLRRLKTIQKESKLHRDLELEGDRVAGMGQEAPTEISLSLSSSASSDTFTEKEDVVLGSENRGSLVDKLRIHSHSSVSIIGRRREMEDAVRVEIGFLEGFDFFGVYDGHGGSQVSRACEQRFHEVVASEAASAIGDGGEGMVNWEKVMSESFQSMDGEVCDVGKTVGSTAVVAVVGKNDVVVANCGDSRAVMSRGGIAVPLSDDHKVIILQVLNNYLIITPLVYFVVLCYLWSAQST